MEQVTQIAEYLGWAIGLIFMPLIQIGKGQTWWPGAKAGKPYDPRPVLFGIVFAVLFGSAYVNAPEITITQLQGITEGVLIKATTATGGGALLHYVWQKIRK